MTTTASDTLKTGEDINGTIPRDVDDLNVKFDLYFGDLDLDVLEGESQTDPAPKPFKAGNSQESHYVSTCIVFFPNIVNGIKMYEDTELKNIGG